MSKPIFVLNGPNLNRLGKREPEIYGRTTLAEIEAMCREAAGDRPVRFHQSNIEGEIVNWIHEAIDDGAAILINPAGLSFISIPVLDALKMFPGPIVELHISNIHRREEIYHRSLVSKVATGSGRRVGRPGLSVGDQLAAGAARRVNLMSEPCIIAVAITGSLPRKQDNPAVPISVAEQIESTHQAFDAGASLVHIHVRNDDQSSSSDPARFAAVQEGVRKHCPGMIVQFSTGGRGRDPAARGSALYLKPDMASLSTGSVNFPSIVYENHPTLVDELAAKMKANGVLPEIEIFDLSHLHAARRLADLGLIGERPHIQFVMGVQNALAGARADSRYPACRGEGAVSPLHLERRRNWPQPDDRHAVGAGARGGRGAHRPGRQYSSKQGAAGGKQRGTGRPCGGGGGKTRPARGVRQRSPPHPRIGDIEHDPEKLQTFRIRSCVITRSWSRANPSRSDRKAQHPPGEEDPAGVA